LQRLGDDKADVVCKAIRKPPTPVLSGIGMTERGLHPDPAIAHLDREGRHVVGPEVESAAAFEVKAGVVPMAGQDAILEAAPLEREAHVRASIVEREDAPTIVDDEDWAMGTMHDESALRLQTSRLPASAKSMCGTFMIVPPVVAAVGAAIRKCRAQSSISRTRQFCCR
jgi:hypothetical protein